MISPESIKKLKESIDIIEIVRSYLPNLKSSGRNYFTLCPFHSEKTPSFSIAPDKGLIHCFGCGYTADIIKFVKDIENISYYEAVEKIAQKVNFTLEYVDPEKQRIIKERYDESKTLLNLLTKVADIYHEILLNSDLANNARKYLISRGIKIETIKQFKIGYAPAGNYIVKNYKTILDGYDISTMYKAGIINFSNEEKDNVKKYEHPYDYFRERIVFPVFNLSGKVVGFGGRIVPGSVYETESEPPTYLNSPETPVFSKRNVLYGLFQSKEYIIKEKMVCVVEGYMDVVILFQEGLKTVVAPLGTSLTEQQVRLLKRFTERVYLMFDPDTAGIEATISGAKVVFASDCYPEVVVLDENKDPDEYILQYGIDKVKSLIKNSVSVIKYVVGNYFKDPTKIDLVKKISLLRKFAEVINSIPNPIIKSEFIKELAGELRIDELAIRSEYKKISNKYRYNNLIEIDNIKPYSCEEELLWMCVHHPEVISDIDEEVFSHENVYLEIFKAIKNHYIENGNLKDVDAIVKNLSVECNYIFIRLVFDEKKLTTSVEERIKNLFLEVYRNKLKKRYKELKPIVDNMLEGKTDFNVQLVNEYKQLLETLKLDRRRVK